MTQAARTNLAHQIASQPDELERLLTSGSVRQEVHAAAEALHRVRRIWMVGTGTSQHAAHLGAAMLQDAGRSAHAVSSMQFVKNAPIVGPKVDERFRISPISTMICANCGIRNFV